MSDNGLFYALAGAAAVYVLLQYQKTMQGIPGVGGQVVGQNLNTVPLPPDQLRPPTGAPAGYAAPSNLGMPLGSGASGQPLGSGAQGMPLN